MSYPSPPAEVPPAPAPRLRWLERTALVLAGSVLIGLLVTAARLEPSPAGLGTHQQLGLPACSMRQWFGIRCPSCGMTTSWAHLVRGQVISACRANVGGVLLAAVSLIAGPWLLVSGLAGRWFYGTPNELATLIAAIAIAGISLIDWTIRLSFGW